jgi:uncharacterized protein YuzE
MKVQYDKEVDALYIKLSDERPDGVIEIGEGVNIDTTLDGRLSGIEILDASKKMDLNTILSYTLEFDKNALLQNVA